MSKETRAIIGNTVSAIIQYAGIAFLIGLMVLSYTGK